MSGKYQKWGCIRVHFVLRPVWSYILAIFWYFLGPTWNSPIGCGVSFESSWWTRFNGSAKTYADWVWYSLYIGELSQPFISRICCKGYDGSMADIKARSRCTCSITMRLWNCVNKWYIHSKPHRSVRHLASVWGAIHYVRKLVWGEGQLRAK